MNRFWAAVTVSEFGTQVTTLAMPLFVLVTLNGSATDVGLLNAARWAPYLLFGLLAGALIDRWRRLPVLVTADLGRALLLGTAASVVRDLAVLMVIVFLVGLLSLGHDVASQSFLPRLVDRARLPHANARLAQTGSAAAATGPLVGGGLVSALGAPLSILLDAVSYVACGLLLATLKTAEPPAPKQRGTIREGLAWVYGHPMLRPLALNTHAWMIFSAAVGAVYVPFATRVLGLSPVELGVTLAAAGVGGVLGGAVSMRVAQRLGLGRAAVTARFLPIVAFGLIAVSQDWALAAAGQFLFWFGIGVESPGTLAFRQAVTPDRLQGRMNATIRSLNWGMVTIGAPLGGLLADTAGHRVALGVATAGFAVTAVTFACSRFRSAEQLRDVHDLPTGPPLMDSTAEGHANVLPEAHRGHLTDRAD